MTGQVTRERQLLQVGDALPFDDIERLGRMDVPLGTTPANAHPAQRFGNGRLRHLDLMVGF
jgi:hypothetical protein